MPPIGNAETLSRRDAEEDWVADGELLAVMDSQHSELATQFEKVRAAMLTWSVACTAEQGTLLVDALVRFSDMLDQHLSAEEELVVPLMEQLITASEWDRMVQKGAAAADPATLPLGFGMLMYEGDPEIVGRALSVMPARCLAAAAVVADTARLPVNLLRTSACRAADTATPAPQ